jgi:hypothetical protein
MGIGQSLVIILAAAGVGWLWGNHTLLQRLFLHIRFPELGCDKCSAFISGLILGQIWSAHGVVGGLTVIGLAGVASLLATEMSRRSSRL